MLVTALWNSAWCPIGCRAAWTPCRASGRTRGTGLLKVLYRSEMFRHDANVRALLPAGWAFLFSRADVSASHSVLHQLRALHLLRSHLRLQLCQHQQGGVRPHLLFLRRRVQSAGLRQVCAATTHSRSVAFTQSVTRHSWPTAFPDASVFYWGHPVWRRSAVHRASFWLEPVSPYTLACRL